MVKGEKLCYDGCCCYSYEYYVDDELCVVCFVNLQEGFVVFDDQICGLIEFSNQELDDFIICCIDGFLIYNFCVVVDDWDMEIIYVICGEDYINNMLCQINIFKVLKVLVLVYVYVFMINGDDGKKLFKCYGVVSVMQYCDDGYLLEVLLNYLVCLGWFYGDQEIFICEEMIKYFILNVVSKFVSVFNIDKLLWLNYYYINVLLLEYVVIYLQWYIEQENIDICNGLQLVDLVKLLGECCKMLKEMVQSCCYFYEDFVEFDVDVVKKYLCLVVCQLLEVVCDKLVVIIDWIVENVYYVIQVMVDELEVGMGKVGMLLCVVVIGVGQFLVLDVIVYVIGKICSIECINKVLDFIVECENQQ